MNPADPRTLGEARALVRAFAAGLDPRSRYVAELDELVAAAADLADLERRLLAGCRGLRHAGPDVFAAMTLREKILANLVTPETTLFRFTEGELEALDREILPRLHGRTARVLVVPCSLGDEAFTMAAFLLKRGLAFEIRAFDLQPQLVEIARTGRLTFGYPPEYLAAAGRVSADVLRRIRFEVGDAFNLPLPAPPGMPPLPTAPPKLDASPRPDAAPDASAPRKIPVAPVPAPLVGEGKGGGSPAHAPHASDHAGAQPAEEVSASPCLRGEEGSFDVVLCRNFVGYFVPEKALEVTMKLAARVAPGGVLFLDGFCLLKFPALQPALEKDAFTRQGDRPVFLRKA
ncbi:MAG: hypothetical protein KIS92_22210 [Planctomycetota bacterium]|nr:hypothetical protein [Planctomycetota bacterium]